MKAVRMLGSILFLLISIGCKSRLEKDIASMMNNKFEFDSTAVRNIESDISLNPNYDDRFSLIVYYDSLECMACHSNRLNSWNKLIQICNDHNVGVYFIFSPKKNEISNLKMNILRQRFRHPVYIDTCSSIREYNPWIPDNTICHTFLLNNEHKVTMVGDPRKTQALMDYFLSMVN